MPLLLPNLDDRTWADLVAEATSLIPVYGPQWTDQNYSDPGITLVELCAWVAEMDIYQLNQISDRERLKFLALVGVAPKPPLPAHVVLSLSLKSGVSPVTVPEGLEFSGVDPFGVATRYRLLRSLTVAPGAIAAVEMQDPAGYHDLTPQWRRGAAISPFGAAPRPGMAFYLGLSAALPVNEPAQLFFTFSGGHSGFEERLRLIRRAQKMEKLCNPKTDDPCKKPRAKSSATALQALVTDQALTHYGVRTSWQYLANAAGQPQWVTLDPTHDEVLDDTRAFTLDGTVTFSITEPMAQASVGAVAAQSYYLRCVFEAGSFDAAPSLQNIAFNGALAEQAVPATSALAIDCDATIVYSPQGPPVPNTITTLDLSIDPQTGNIVQLTFGAGSATDPQFRTLSFTAPAAGKAGMLCVEAVFLGFGTGFPHQRVTLPDAPVEASSLHLYTLEDGAWRAWEPRTDFFASMRKDSHAILNATTGMITFGDGDKGRVPPPDCAIFATCFATRAQAGNLIAGTIAALADSPHNRAILYDSTAVPDGWTQLNNELAQSTTLAAAWGGAAAETIDQAAGEADQLVESSGRAVTLADYERLALATPGTRIARVTAIAGMHPDFPCFQAPGMITVIVLPYLPQGSPTPTPGLLRAVAAYLRPRRVIGSRVEVVGPIYFEVIVQATLQSITGTNKTTLQQAIVAALNNFLDPLVGGPDGTGWPFGRDVYRAEIMKVIDAVPGVDYITSLSLLAYGGQPQCGNVCLGPTWLVEAGAHQITVN
jgi:Baseplate J-like protein